MYDPHIKAITSYVRSSTTWNRSTCYIKDHVISIIFILVNHCFFLPLSVIFFHRKNEAAHKERLKHKVFVRFDYLLCSQVWLPTVQDVLHADWQDVWHSPHPPFFTVFCNVLFVRVLICFILSSS